MQSFFAGFPYLLMYYLQEKNKMKYGEKAKMNFKKTKNLLRFANLKIVITETKR